MKTKKLCILIFAVCFAAVTGAGFIVSQLYIPVSSRTHAVQEKVQIPMGTGTIKVAKLLKEKGLIRSEKFFVLAARVPFFYGRVKPYAIKSGIYNIDSSMTQASILELLDSGKQEYLKVVFPEGLTLGKIAVMLEAEGVCPAADFREAATSYELLEKYQIPADSLEGYLFPDTYFFNPSMDAKAVVSMMVDNFFDRIKTIQGLSEKSPSELYNILIMASIVEREYRVESEAPLIASVFYNRLEDNVGFYSCATIEYIITEILGRPHPDVITYEDLQINSPYNTYKWAGLPPSPISNPGLVALSAAANPPKTDYYYFTLTNAEKGTHAFTKSFGSHIRAGMQLKTKKAATK